MNYYLYVYKEETSEVNVNINELVNVETPIKEEITEYAIPIISSICFLIILFSFVILFRKKKKTNH